ncbi:Hypothetical predicted protein [Paramuricea clavata]|uniref:Uncharacterized protein n=1 Tax=Paramuricea clavata TaxID=317549 RepID=A0A7D9DWV2_PARCT|nr:Hypothetical predicted protein [Paramuricea clavata]
MQETELAGSGIASTPTDLGRSSKDTCGEDNIQEAEGAETATTSTPLDFGRASQNRCGEDNRLKAKKSLFVDGTIGVLPRSRPNTRGKKQKRGGIHDTLRNGLSRKVPGQYLVPFKMPWIAKSTGRGLVLYIMQILGMQTHVMTETDWCTICIYI